MLKQVEYLDYSSNNAYAPGHSNAVINTQEIVKALQIRPENTRSSYEIMRVWFRDGTCLDVVGKLSDLIDKEQP